MLAKYDDIVSTVVENLPDSDSHCIQRLTFPVTAFVFVTLAKLSFISYLTFLVADRTSGPSRISRHEISVWPRQIGVISWYAILCFGRVVHKQSEAVVMFVPLAEQLNKNGEVDTLFGALYLPPNYSEEKKYPTVRVTL